MSLTRNSRGFIEGATSGVTWGLSTVLIALVLTMSPFADHPLTILGGVFIITLFNELIGTLLLGGALGATGRLRGLSGKLLSRESMLCVISGIFGGPVAMTFYIYAISQGGPAVASTITASYPVIGLVLAYLFLREKVTTQVFAGVLVCIMGILYLSLGDSADSNAHVGMGVTLALLSAVCWAIEAVNSGYAMRNGKLSPSEALLVRQVSSTVAYVIGFFYVAEAPMDIAMLFRSIGTETQGWMLLLVAAAIGIASMLLWYRSIHVLGSARGICLNVTYCFWALVFGYLLLGDELTTQDIMGGVLMLGGVYLACSGREVLRRRIMVSD